MADAYPWQESLWQQFSSRPTHAHAYLMHGPVGVGKRAFLERLAALLLCQQSGVREACGQCKGCLLRIAGSHPDLFELRPADDKKTVGVDDVRELIGFVNKTPQLGGRKVITVLEPAVEDMTLAASNALLKSLEEPAGNTVLLLLSHQPGRLLPTIKSRCVLQASPLPDATGSLAYLHTRLPELDAQTAAQLLQLAAGSPLRAERMYAEGLLEQRALVVEGVKKLFKQQIAPSPLAESWNAVPLLALFDWFCDWAQLILRHQLTRDEAGLGAVDMAKVVQYLAQKAPQSRVLALQDWLLAQRQKVLGKALNKRLDDKYGKH